MSHFTVLVISDNPNDINERLAPFEESPEKPSPYLEFKDKEDECLKEYQEDGKNTFYGRRLNTTKEFYEKLKETGFVHVTGYESPIFTRESEVPADDCIGRIDYWKRGEGWHGNIYVSIQNVTETEETRDGRKFKIYEFDAYTIPEPAKYPFTKIYPTFEEYMQKWCGYESRDSQHNRYGYWYNPQAKWDWYQIGGRWPGMLMLKKTVDETEGEKGEISWAAGKDFQYKSKECDQLQFKNLDTESMVARDRVEAGEYWDKTIADAEEDAVKYYDTGKTNKEDYANREAYVDSQIQLRIEDYKPGMTKEDYIKLRTSDHPLQTFAVLTKDGKWHEKGDMGWWGIVTNEDKPKYDQQFEKILADIEPNDYLTVVDCHI